jgi:hypothetical protein
LIAKYGEVLIKARATISGWGGRLVFVYLPDPPRFFSLDAPLVKAASVLKNKILTLAKKTGVTVIDLEPTFDSHAKPSDLTYAASTHYSEAVYKLAADTIAKALGLNRR